MTDDTPSSDAELLRLCAVFADLEQQRHALQNGPDAIKDDVPREIEAIFAKQVALVMRIKANCAATLASVGREVHTREGIRAVQRTLNKWLRYGKTKTFYLLRQAGLLAATEAYGNDTLREDLYDAAAPLGQAAGIDWDRHSPSLKDDLESSGVAVTEYNKAVRAAFRGGHRRHPIVQEWEAARRALGENQPLRPLWSFEPGLTEDVPSPMSLDDIWLCAVLEDCATNSPAKMRQLARSRLAQDDWLPDFMSFLLADAARSEFRAALRSRMGSTRQNFEAWLRSLGLYQPRARRRPK